MKWVIGNPLVLLALAVIFLACLASFKNQLDRNAEGGQPIVTQTELFHARTCKSCQVH